MPRLTLLVAVCVVGLIAMVAAAPGLNGKDGRVYVERNGPVNSSDYSTTLQSPTLGFDSMSGSVPATYGWDTNVLATKSTPDSQSAITDSPTAVFPPFSFTVQNRMRTTTVESIIAITPIVLSPTDNALNVLAAGWAYVCSQPYWTGDCSNYFIPDTDDYRCMDLRRASMHSVGSMGPDEGLICHAFGPETVDCSGKPLGNSTHDKMEIMHPGIVNLKNAGVPALWGSLKCSRDPKQLA